MRVPTVLSVQEVQRIFDAMPQGSMRRMMVELLLRRGVAADGVLHLAQSRFGFRSHKIVIRSGKGDKDRIVMLPRRSAGAGRAGSSRTPSARA